MSHPIPVGGPRWYCRLSSAETFLIRIEGAFCALMLVIMLFTTAAMVVARNAAIAIPNIGEIGLAAIVPLTLIGGALCTATASHVAIDIIKMARWAWVVRGAELLVTAATLIFAWIYIGSGLYLVAEFRATGDKLLDLGTPLWLLALCFPIGMVLMSFHAVMRVGDAFLGRRLLPNPMVEP